MKLNCKMISCPGKLTITPKLKPLVKTTQFGTNLVFRVSAKDGGNCRVCGAPKGWLKIKIESSN